MKAAHHIFEYLTAFAVVVLFSAVILFFPEMGPGELHSDGSATNTNGPVATEQPAAAVTPHIKTEGQANS